MKVVGVGSQGSLEDADSFIAEAGLRTPQVLWDADYRVWNHYEVFGQPTAILVDRSGQIIHTFGGAFNGDDVLARI